MAICRSFLDTEKFYYYNTSYIIEETGMSRARIGEDAVQARTGRNWQQWFSILDKAGAMKMSHKEMAKYLWPKVTKFFFSFKSREADFM